MPIQLSAWFILLLLFENLWKCYFWQSRDFKFPKFSHSVPSMVVPRSSSLPDHVHVSQIINCPCCIMFNFIQPYIPNREHLMVGGTSIKTDLRGCLYGSEPARVPELTRFPKMNFTTCLHETFGAGWLVKTNTNFCGKVWACTQRHYFT
jgi:hypothetical protein